MEQSIAPGTQLDLGTQIDVVLRDIYQPIEEITDNSDEIMEE